MNHVARIGRSLTRRAGALLTHRAAVPAAAATPRPEAPRRNEHSPLPAPARTAVTAELYRGTRPHAPREKLRTTILPARLPHAIQLCIHCRERPAGFWVSRTGGQTVRRPWCLSCCEELDRDHCDVIRFPSQQDAVGTSQKPRRPAPSRRRPPRPAGFSHNGSQPPPPGRTST